MTDNLTCELLRRVFGNVGAVPGTNFGKAGLVIPDCLFGKQVSAELDDGSVSNYPVWIGRAGSTEFRAAISNLGTAEDPEFILVLISGEATQAGVSALGFKLHWNENYGIFSQATDKGWQPVSVLHRLNLTAAFELLTQEGVPWIPIQDNSEQLYNLLLSFIEAEE